MPSAEHYTLGQLLHISPPIVHFADFEGCATHEEYFEIASLLLEAEAVQDMWTCQLYSFYVWGTHGIAHAEIV